MSGARAGARVLVARLDNVGDVLLTGPAVRAVARRAEVTFLAGPAGSAAARMLPGVRDVLVYDAPWVGYRPPLVNGEVTAALVRTLADRHFDAAIIFTSFHQSPLPLALLARLAGIPHISATSVDYPGSLLDVRRAPVSEQHEVEEALDLAAEAGFPRPADDDGRLAVVVPPAPPRPLPGRPGGGAPSAPSIVVHPGASVAARGIPPLLAAHATSLLGERGWSVRVSGGPEERELCSAVAAAHPAAIDCSGTSSLSELAEVLSGASALVSGNTGPAHLAAALGVPVVSVFAPVVPWHRWRPWGVPTEPLGWQDIECAGCRSRTCPRPGQPCTATISGWDVVGAVDRLVRQGRRASPGPMAAALQAGRR